MFNNKKIKKLEAENVKLHTYLATISENFVQSAREFDVRLQRLEELCAPKPPPVEPNEVAIINRMECTGETWDVAKAWLIKENRNGQPL